MGNTGIKITVNLDQAINPYPPGPLTGSTKPNLSTNPDYVPPTLNLDDCPVTPSTECPDLAASGVTGAVQYEFSISPAVEANTSIASVRIRLMNSSGTTEIQGVTYTFPMTPARNYKISTFTGVSAGNYRIDAKYLNSSSGTVADCANLDAVTVT